MLYNLSNPEDRKKYLEDVEKYLLGQKEVDMFPKGKKRRNKANRLYWAWMQCHQDEHGQDKDDYHDHYKSLFLGTFEKELFGNVITKEASTANLPVRPFWEYMQKVQVEAATEFGIIVPLPKDRVKNKILVEINGKMIDPNKGYDEFVRKYHWCF